MAKKKNLKRAINKMLVDRRPEEIAEAILATIPWDRLMLAMANVAWGQGQKQTGRTKKAWLGRGRIFHRVMDEIFLQKAKGSPFKINRRDYYVCKCKKKFLVDPAIQKNIAYDMTQCEFIVTCPHCGKQEDLKKAKTFLKKAEKPEPE